MWQVADVRKYQQWDHYGRGSSCIIRTSSDESQFATSIVELHFLHLLHCYINSSSYICYIVQSTLSDYSRITYSTAMASTMQWTLAKYSVSDLSTKCQRKTYILENVSSQIFPIAMNPFFYIDNDSYCYFCIIISLTKATRVTDGTVCFLQKRKRRFFWRKRKTPCLLPLNIAFFTKKTLLFFCLFFLNTSFLCI